MNSEHRQVIHVASPAELLAVIPPLIGFHPARSLVVIGLASPPRSHIKVAFRYDLPDPPDPEHASDIAEHALSVLAGQKLTNAIAVGYGPGHLVTPVADTLRARLRTADVALHELLRVEQGRYWSYMCTDPTCCPAAGTPFDEASDPAAAMAAAGQNVLPDRAALAATIAPPAGQAAASAQAAAERAEARARQLTAAAPDPRVGLRLLITEGRSAVAAAIATYREGGTITSDDEIAWLALTLRSLPVRDDAWARMDPEHTDAHRRLWSDVTHRAAEPDVPAPASLLAFIAWQSGNGALANIALDRALAADPEYSMALLLRQALDSGVPSSAAVLPMTPEEVAASYADYLAGTPSAGAV